MAGVVVTGLVAAGGLLAAAPANAAPGDASAEGASASLDVDLPVIGFTLDSSVGGISVSNPGSATSSEANYTLVDLLLADITLDAVDTAASSSPAGSQATAEVSGLSASLLGVDLLTLDTATAETVCTVSAAPTAAANLVGLTVLGDGATVDAGTPYTSAPVALGANVGGLDLSGVQLTVTVRQVETTTADSAEAVALIAEVALDGSFLGGSFASEVVATLTLASVSCDTSAIVPVTAAAIDPAVGPTTGGQTVAITGSGFIPGTTTVEFDGTPATAVTVDPTGTALTAVTPAGAAGPAIVTVANPGSSDTLDYTYVAPMAASLSPTSGPDYGGTTVTITGQGLNPTTDVTFDGASASIVSVSPDGTQVVVVSPAGTGTVDVELTVGGGATIMADEPFTYIAPEVADIDPAAGPVAGGTTVTITGEALGGTTDVLFDGAPATIVSGTDTLIVVVTPPGTAGLADVTIVLPGDDLVIDGGYLYLPVPVATGAHPGEGSTTGGTVVDVDGSGFVPGATTITVCGVTIAAGQVTVNDAGTRARFTTPACAAGPTTIVVATPGGLSEPVGFRYTSATPANTGGTGGLANTGGHGAGPAVGISLVLLALGGLAITGVYRRRRA